MLARLHLRIVLTAALVVGAGIGGVARAAHPPAPMVVLATGDTWGEVEPCG